MVHFEKCQNKTLECFLRVISLLFPKLIVGQNDQKFITRFTVMFSIKKKAGGCGVWECGVLQEKKTSFSPDTASPVVGLGQNPPLFLQPSPEDEFGLKSLEMTESPGLSSGSSPWPLGLAHGFHPSLPHGFHPPLPHFLSL